MPLPLLFFLLLAYDLNTAAHEISMSVWTLRRWLKAGRLIATKPSPNKILIERSELERLLQGGRQKVELASTTDAPVNG